MIVMKAKDAIELDTVWLDKTYPEEILLPKDDLCIYLISLVDKLKTKKQGDGIYLELPKFKPSHKKDRYFYFALFVRWT